MGNVPGNASTVHATDDSEMVIDNESRTAGEGPIPMTPCPYKIQ